MFLIPAALVRDPNQAAGSRASLDSAGCSRWALILTLITMVIFVSLRDAGRCVEVAKMFARSGQLATSKVTNEGTAAPAAGLSTREYEHFNASYNSRVVGYGP